MYHFFFFKNNVRTKICGPTILPPPSQLHHCRCYFFLFVEKNISIFDSTDKLPRKVRKNLYLQKKSLMKIYDDLLRKTCKQIKMTKREEKKNYKRKP